LKRKISKEGVKTPRGRKTNPFRGFWGVFGDVKKQLEKKGVNKENPLGGCGFQGTNWEKRKGWIEEV